MIGVMVWKGKTKKAAAGERAQRSYRTSDNKIDGAVLTLVDIDGTKKGDAAKTENRTKNVSSRK